MIRTQRTAFHLVATAACSAWLAALWPAPAAAGVVQDFAPNFVAISVAADASFIGVVIDPGTPGSDFAIAAPGAPIPYRNLVSASTSAAPTTGAAKDTAAGTVALRFDPGVGAAADSFSITASGSASASAAFAADGSPAAARVSLSGSAFFRVDAGFGGVAPGTAVGRLLLDGLRAPSIFAPAGPVEVFTLSVSDASTGAVLASLLPGGGPAAVTLHADRSYEIGFKYQFDVPHGIDPPFDWTAGGSIAAIPELPAAWLLAAGLPLLAAGRKFRLRKNNV